MARKRQRGNGQGSLMQREPGGPWIAKWFDHNGRRKEKSTRTTDKAAAARILAKWCTAATLRREGVIDARAEALAVQGRRPMAEHLADFKAALLAKGASPEHADTVLARTRKVMDAAGFRRWADTSASHAMEYLKGLRADKETRDEAGQVVKRQRGISAQTFNFYLRSIKQFGRWMVKDRRATDNPFAYLEPLNIKLDRRRDRRALTADELRTLISTTDAGPERYRMTGKARALLYRLAVETGFRAGEVRSLTRAGFNLDGDEPTVTVGAAYSKRRREDTLPIRPELAALLREYLANKAPAALAFNAPRNRWSFGDMFKADRDAAGIAARDDAGRVVDFHALRHTFISNLAAGGVYPKTAQALARHSTITLTMDRYTHQYGGDERAALAVLPDLTIPAAVAKALGTDNSPATPDRTPTSSPTSSRAKWQQSGASGRDESGENLQEDDGGRSAQKPSKNAELRDLTQPGASIGGGEWESNPPTAHSGRTLALKTRGTTRHRSPPNVLLRDKG